MAPRYIAGISDLQLDLKTQYVVAYIKKKSSLSLGMYGLFSE
jgi:hypothetical protein